jgi:hypothetical protein
MIQLCDSCKSPLADYDTIIYGSPEGGHRDLCSRCFNQEIARINGLDFKHVGFQPIDLMDARGVVRRFHFVTRLLGDRVALDAFELRGGRRFGRGFQMIDDPEVDLFDLKRRLEERMRRALGRTHLRESHLGLQIADETVRAEIYSDPAADHRQPLLIIDGQEITWSDFGRMLMTFEGWSFKLEIKDPSEEV